MIFKYAKSKNTRLQNTLCSLHQYKNLSKRSLRGALKRSEYKVSMEAAHCPCQDQNFCGNVGGKVLSD